MYQPGLSGLPLLSTIDHECRRNAHPAEQQNVREETEKTPLLRRLPQSVPTERNISTYALVSLLLSVLVAGVVIGIYLLVLQNKFENLLPGAQVPLQIVTRMQWDKTRRALVSLSPFKANYISVVPTNTEQCNDLKSCVKLLNAMQMASQGKTLPYNFLVSSNGQLFEASGWQNLNSSSLADTLVLALIGNFTQDAPTKLQIEEANRFILVSDSLGYLVSNFIVSTNISTYTIHR